MSGVQVPLVGNHWSHYSPNKISIGLDFWASKIWFPKSVISSPVPVFISRCNLSVSALKGLLSSSSIWKVCPLRMISSSPWYKSVWCSSLFWPVLELSRSTERTVSFISERGRLNRKLTYVSVSLLLWIVICATCRNLVQNMSYNSSPPNSMTLPSISFASPFSGFGLTGSGAGAGAGAGGLIKSTLSVTS